MRLFTFRFISCFLSIVAGSNAFGMQEADSDNCVHPVRVVDTTKLDACCAAPESHTVLFNGSYQDESGSEEVARVLFVNVGPYENEKIHEHTHFSFMFLPIQGCGEVDWVPVRENDKDPVLGEIGQLILEEGNPSRSFDVMLLKQEVQHYVVGKSKGFKALRIEYNYTAQHPGQLAFIRDEDEHFVDKLKLNPDEKMGTVLKYYEHACSLIKFLDKSGKLKDFFESPLGTEQGSTWKRESAN
jgi:hypothetical protein